MLVITRKPHEEFVLVTATGLVVVKILDNKSGKTRLGIEAPREVLIYRREILPPELEGEIQ